MPVQVPLVRTGRVVTPQFVPAHAIGVTVQPHAYVFDTTDDFYALDIQAQVGTRVLATPLQVSPRFAGMHYHSQRPTVVYSIARSVDTPGCGWWHIEAAGRGVYDWSALDAFVADASAHGRELVFNFLGTPTWASARPIEAGHYVPGSDAEPARLEDLGAFAAALCARYRARGTPIAAFEVWNEPKYAGGGGVEQGNYFSGTPAALAGMARVIHQAVKAIDPAALILSPAPTGLEYPWIAGDGSGTDHLDRFFAAPDGAGGSGRDWVDVVAFHAYSHNGQNDLYAIPQMVANVQACMARHALAGRPIWITETSAITPALDTFVVQHQKDYIARTLLLALGCGVERIVWYAWDDPLGFHRQPEVARRWDELVTAFSGATFTVVNSLVDKRVAAVIDGKRWLV